MTTHVVGLDLGGTKIRAVLVDGSGDVLEERSVPTDASEGPEGVVERIYELLASFSPTRPGSNIRAIGLCSPGPVDTESGVVLTPPNLPGWMNVPLRHLVQERFGLPTYLDKDVNAAAFAELQLGAAKDHRHAIYVTVGTGIGGAVIVDGRIFRGTGLAGEVGHMILLADGPPCKCGSNGCLEVLASGRAIETAAASAAASPGSPLAARLNEAGRLTSHDVAEVARSGDRVSRQIIEAAGRYLGLGIASLINLLSPEAVVVGGGLTGLGKPYLGVAREVAGSSYVHRQREAMIETGAFPDIGGALGAALLAIDAEDSA